MARHPSPNPTQTYQPAPEVDEARLSALVRKALDRPGLQVTEWQAQELHGGVQWDSDVVRKTLRPSARAAEPGGIWYWKREALAYASGMLANLPGGGVTAPACYVVEERPDGVLWLWLEDICDDVPCPWSVEQYALAARHLGRWSGVYLAGVPLPEAPWLPRRWLRMYVEHAAPMVAFLRANPRHPVVQHMFPGIVLPQVLAIWEERQGILDLLESLPQVFCHQDAFRRNLFACRGRTVAIDWAYMGIAPVGTELVALVAASLGFFEIPPDQVWELDRRCFEGYLEGLAEAGWKGDPRLVRTGYAVGLMLRYPIGGQVGELLPTFLDQARRSQMSQSFENKTPDQLEKTDPAIIAYYEGIMPESLKLLGPLKMARLLARIGGHALRLKAIHKEPGTTA